MLIDFSKIQETVVPNFKGGEKTLSRRAAGDELCLVMQGCLLPGASIGEHTHADSSEVIFVLSGTASIVCDGAEETVSIGQAHYCPKGSTHTMKNRGDGELRFLAVVPKQ